MNVDEAQVMARSSGRRFAEVLADEVDRLSALLVLLETELYGTRDTLAELNEALAETFPQIDAAIHAHPSAQPAPDVVPIHRKRKR